MREHELTVEVTKPDGRVFHWAPDEPLAENIYSNLSFSTKRMEGFERASCVLQRRGDQDQADIDLYDSVVIRSGTGDVCYEGRISAQPRSLDENGWQVQVEMSGWMSHARDRKFTQIYVDRDLGNWGAPTLERQLYLSDTARTTKFVIVDQGSVALAPNGNQALHLVLDRINSSGAIRQMSTSVYDAEDIDTISAVWYRVLTRDDAGTVLNPAAGNWANTLSTSATSDAATFETTGSLASASTGFHLPTIADARFVFAQLYPFVDLTADGSWNAWWEFAVYGSSGVPLAGEDLPLGVTASEVIKHICGFCPMLNPGRVDDTGHVIGHLAFRDRTDPYDGFLEVNRYHRWELAVYENRTLHFFPADLTQADWVVRTDDPGVTVQWQGDTTESLANGIVVQFEDVVTGNSRTITPEDDERLADLSELNPANRSAGYPIWTEQTLSTPCTYEDAVAIGVALLAEFNQVKAPGTVQVGAWVRDRFGVLQPSHQVRAMETVAVEDYVDARPRLITSTDYSDDARTCSIGVEGGTYRVDAWLDRLSTAVQAQNLAA